MFFLIAASVADATAINPNGIKKLLVTGVSTFSINDKPFFINGPINPLSCFKAYSVVSFNESPLFCENLITLIISLIRLFFSVMSEPVIDESFSLSVLPTISNLAFKRNFGMSYFPIKEDLYCFYLFLIKLFLVLSSLILLWLIY